MINSGGLGTSNGHIQGEMVVIAAIILGGTRMTGGIGKRLYSRDTAVDNGYKQPDPGRYFCVLAEGIYRCDHYYWNSDSGYPKSFWEK